jgi:hypothetical protein
MVMAKILADYGPPLDASSATDATEWLACLAEMVAQTGYLEPLGQRHWALAAIEGPTLLVTFEGLDDIRAQHPSQLPLGFRVARSKGWSHLCIIADGPTWWRDGDVYGFIDTLIDAAFLEDFDKVLFYGAGAGAYAAATFSVAAPGATVLAIQPVATLDPSIAGWDRRFITHRRLNFTDRYGYAPDMVQGANQVFLVLDPTQKEDAMHAALFQGPQIARLHCPYFGQDIEQGFLRMGRLIDLIEAAGEGRMTSALFATQWRARRSHRPYLTSLINLNRELGNSDRAIRVCRHAIRTLNDLRFKHLLDDLLRD